MTDRELEIVRIISQEFHDSIRKQYPQWVRCREVSDVAWATIHAAAKRIAETEMTRVGR
jgi:hypothetical protein